MPAPRRGWRPRCCLALLVLANVLVSPASPRRSAGSKLMLRILVFENCDGPQFPLHLLEKSMWWVKDHGHMLDATVAASKTIKSFRMIFVALERCRDLNRPNTCEYYATWSWKTAICNFIFMPGMMWAHAVRSVTPAIKSCPLKAGTYRAHNTSWDANAAMIREVMEDGMIWKGDLVFTDENNATAACMRGAVQGVKHNIQ